LKIIIGDIFGSKVVLELEVVVLKSTVATRCFGRNFVQDVI
jgi:hypothetical protein